MSLLEAKRLEKHYGDQVVLERLNFRVEPGEFVTLVGASGCGKTTFLKMLLGTERPSRGQLLLDGTPIPDEPDETRGIVFQRYSVLPHLTALQNASSIAGLLLTTECMITDIPEKEEAPAGGHSHDPGMGM